MRKYSGLAWACLASCSLATDPAAPGGETGRILLEIEYVNFAWVPTHLGFFIDAAGNVYSYDREGAAWAHSDSLITEAELNEKLALNRVLVATRDSTEMATVAARIAQVVPGQLSQPKSPCADAGVLTYRAYLFNAANRTYRPIPLRKEGDLAQQNLSAAAQQLIAYLRSLNLRPETSGCDP